MVTVQLCGGLGNQMFQYAAGRALAERARTELVLDPRLFGRTEKRAFVLDRLRVRGRVATSAELSGFPAWQFAVLSRARFKGRVGRWYLEPRFGYDAYWQSLGDGVYLSGYFQVPRYFESIRSELVEELQPTLPLSGSNRELAERINSTPSVAIHVRRGDYVADTHVAKFHGVCSSAYYQAAVDHLCGVVDDPAWYVFSDDMEWARENLQLPGVTKFVEGNAATPEVDLHLMTLCHHHVISNSTFSWWGAWLCAHVGQVVIAPEPWFDGLSDATMDLVPGNWLRFEKC